jgi:hypothetical protein
MTGDLTMPARTRRLTAWIAIFAITLQAVLVGFSVWTPAAAATIDPATVICHSVPANADSGQQAPSPAAHDDCCSHCILCGGLLAIDLPAVSGTHILPRLSSIKFIPFSSITPLAQGAFRPNLPRGPPSLT